MPDLRFFIQHTYMTELLSTPEGRAMVLNQAAAAEDSDEGQLFELLEARVDDDELKRMIRKHQADEKRHAALFRECLERNGFEPWPVPEDVQIIARLDRALDGFFERFERGDVGVMEVYLLLQVIEERALTQFNMFEPVFRVYDPESADVFVTIAADERRHLRYCRAISERYAPDPETLRSTLEHYRRVEAEAFAQNSLANMGHTLADGLVGKKPARRWAWKAARALAARRTQPVFTPFAAAHA